MTKIVARALWVVVGLQLFWPVAAYSQPEPQTDSERADLDTEAGSETQTEPQTCEAIAPTPPITTSSYHTERHSLIRLETQVTQAELPLRWEGTFLGNANEIVVLYWDSSEYSIFERFEIYDPQGVRLTARYYPYNLEPGELEGQRKRFDLSQTGEYRLAFTIDPGSDILNALPGTLPPGFWQPPEKLDYLLRVRVISYYERLMLYADQLVIERQPEAALSVYSRAVEQCPNRLEPYIGRLFAYVGIARDLSNIEEDDNPETTEYFETLFQSLDASSQAAVLSDLRWLAQQHRDRHENSSQSSEGPDYQLFDEVADFLETGIASERLLEAIEEF